MHFLRQFRVSASEQEVGLKHNDDEYEARCGNTSVRRLHGG